MDQTINPQPPESRTSSVSVWAICRGEFSAALSGLPGQAARRVGERVGNRHQAPITVGGKTVRNPIPATEENIRAGRKTLPFTAWCATDSTDRPRAFPLPKHVSAGAVPELARGAGLRRRTIEMGDRNGIGPSGMPASKGILNDDEIWSLVNYIRHLPAKGSLGEPKVYNPS